MLLSFLGTISLGVAVAGLTLAAFRLFGRKAPKWILPACAGAAMLGFHIWNEYSWFDRTASALPPHLTVAGTYTRTNPIQPWTLLVAPVDRFSVVDAQSIRENESQPHLKMAQIHLVGRYTPTASTVQIYDCAVPRRADVVRTLEFDAAGRAVNAQWVAVDAADPLRRTICADIPQRGLNDQDMRRTMS